MLQVACSPFITAEEVDCACGDDQLALVEAYIDSASDAIAILTGGVISGLCSETVIPRSTARGYCMCWHWGPYGAGIGQSCSCDQLEGITLRGPNPEIVEVLLYGEPFTDFAIVDDRLLVRTDGQRWPRCQRVTNPILTIEYSYGLAVNQLIKDSCNEIVCWLLKNDPNAAQKVPTGTRGINIAGVQMTLDTIIQEAKRRTLLLPITSRMLTIYSPNGAQPSAVYSPELEDQWQLHRVR